jgi:hypothetical protein
MQPLTHHEILDLVGPFTRRGRHVDLPASDRQQRRLVFKTVVCAKEAHGSADLAALPELRETLQLETPAPGTYRLTRILTPASAPDSAPDATPDSARDSSPGAGPEALLEIEGADPAVLLARLEAVAPQRQFDSGPGFLIALSHRLEAAGSGPDALRMVLIGANAAVAGLTLKLKPSGISDIRAKLELTAAPGDPIELPEDLLAVLGWGWAPLLRTRDAWTSTLRLRGKEPQRSLRTEQKFAITVRHLEKTLGEAPAQFHTQRTAARWGVVLRRAAPLLICIGLIAGAAAVPRLHLAQDSGLRMLILNAPPLLMSLFFCMREVPRIEFPPLPRPLTAPAWRTR